jgi:CRP/FNR family transcriptional regulator
VISFRDEPCTGVYLIVQGVVSAQRLSLEGREYILDYLGPGECFNLVPVLDGGVNLATMQASSAVTLYFIPCDRFLGLVQSYREVALEIATHLAGQVRYLSDAVEDLALYTVRTRLARFLLSRADDDIPHSTRWTQEEIAAHIGTVRDVVGRTLRSFAREGLIRRQRGLVTIADREKLEKEAMTE